MTGESPHAIIKRWLTQYGPRLDSDAFESQHWNVLGDPSFGRREPGIEWLGRFWPGAVADREAGFASCVWLSPADCRRSFEPPRFSNDCFTQAVLCAVGLPPDSTSKLWRLKEAGKAWLAQEAEAVLMLPIRKLAHRFGRPDPNCEACNASPEVHLYRAGTRAVKPRAPFNFSCDCRKLKILWPEKNGWAVTP